MDDSHCNRDFSGDEEVDRQAAYIWFKVKKTQVEMIHDRGMAIPEDEMFLLSYDPDSGETELEWEERTLVEFIRKYTRKAQNADINFNTALSNVYFDDKNDINTAVIYLCRERESTSITTHEFTTKFDFYYENYYMEDKGLNMIFISEVSLNKKEEKVEKLNFVNSQSFLTEELVVNPTRHLFYFPHRLLTEEERKEWLLDNKIRPDQLSIIHKRDPIVKYFNWPKGEIVHIQRSERYLEMPVRDYPYLRVIK